MKRRLLHFVWLAIACFARVVVLQPGDPTCVDNSTECCQQSNNAIARLTSAVSQHSERLDAVDESLRLLRTCSCRGQGVVKGGLEVKPALGATGACDQSGLVPQDCSDVDKAGSRTSGVYQVFIPNNSVGSRLVYCNLSHPTENYLVFQRRKDGSENFERTWKDYAAGFGNLNGEFWLGNDALYVLTNTFRYKLRIDIEDFDGEKRYAEYSSFRIASSADNYRMNVSGYSGDAGDSLTYHSGQQFSTIDADHDSYPSSCAQLFHGAWWYNACHYSNLNGRYLHGTHTSYADGVEWYAFRGYYYSLKSTEMKIVRVV